MDESIPKRRSNLRLSGHRLWIWAGIVGLIVGLAWFDGGEEPLRPISQEIAVPEIAK